MTLYILGLLASVFIGLSLGYLGAGGSIITVPVLVYLLQTDVHQAIAVSLVVVGTTSIAGAYLHHRNKTEIDLRSGLLFGFAGTGAAYAGSRLSVTVPDTILLILFSILMIVVALAMLFGKRRPKSLRGRVSILTILAGGAFVGFLTGFVGVGGGFLIVPALVLLAGLNMRTATATSLLVISLNCVAGFAGHLSSTSIDAEQTIIVAALSLSGMLAGTLLSKGSSPAQLRFAFAMFTLVVGITLLTLNI